jgi:hypothetical protein
MKFFKYFPHIDYTFQNSNGAYVLDLTNTTVHVRLAEAIKKNITVMYDYQIQDGQRPDSVSVDLYGVVDYTWIILLVNNIFTLFDWPLNNDEFNKYIIEKYTSVAVAQALLRYRTVDNYIVDLATFNALDGNQRGEPQTTYDYELNLNDAKRRIRVVPAPMVPAMDRELRKLLAS